MIQTPTNSECLKLNQRYVYEVQSYLAQASFYLKVSAAKQRLLFILSINVNVFVWIVLNLIWNMFEISREERANALYQKAVKELDEYKQTLAEEQK